MKVQGHCRSDMLISFSQLHLNTLSKKPSVLPGKDICLFINTK